MRVRNANSGDLSRRPLAVRAAAWLATALLAGLATAPALGQSVTVTGLTPFPLTYLYQTNQQTLTLNFNNQAILEQIQIGNGFDFYIADNQCPGGYYPAGSTCTVTVTFFPRSPGWSSAPSPIARSAPLLMQYYDFNLGINVPITIPLTGTGTGPQGVMSPGIITDLIGNDSPPLAGYAGDGSPAANARFVTPAAIAMDLLGNIYIADTGNNVIRLYYQAGTFPTIPGTPVVGNVYTIAGIGPTGGVSNGGAGTDGVLATASALNSPAGVAVDAAGNIYIADTNNQAVRMVSATTGIITTIAGTLNSPEAPGTGFSGDLGPANLAQLYIPVQVTVDGNLNVYIADAGNNAVRVVYMGGTALANLIATEIPGTTATVGSIYTIAGGPANTAQPSNGDGALASAANLNYPSGVTVDSIGDVFIADANNNAVRRVDTLSGNISTVYPGTDTPVNLAVDASDNIYFTLQHSCTIQQYNPTLQQGLVTPFTSIVAGNGICSASGDNGPSTAAGLSGAVGVVVDGSGNIYPLESDGVRMVARSQTTMDFGSQNVGTISPGQSVTVSDGDILPYGGGYQGSQPFYFQFSPNYGIPFFTAPFVSINPNIHDCQTGYFDLSPGQSCGATFTFQPTQDGGPFTASAYNNASAQIQLSGTGTGPLPSATLTGGPLNFVAIANETTSPSQPLVLTNTSAVNLSLTSLYFSSFNFQETDNCGFSSYAANPILAPGASCNINVTFAANATGIYNGTMYVQDNASSGGGTQTASVSGTATASLGVLSPSELVSGIVAPGSTQNLVATLTNSGTAIMNINTSGFAVTGYDPGRFTIVGNTCGATLAIGASCQITVQFAPLTYAYYSADLNVQDDSGGVRIFRSTTPPTYLWNTQLLHMVGVTGNPPEAASFTLGNATFPATAVGQTSPPQTVTLTLNTAVPLKSITMTAGFTEYAIGTVTGCVMDGVTVNPVGTICQIPITFSPLWPGTRNAPLSVIDVESGTALPYAFGLTGTGTGPVAALTPGIITTVVGSGHGYAAGITFADGPAVNAQVGFTNGFAIDAAGNQFIADSQNDVIWKVDTAGNIHLYAGTPFPPGGYLQAIQGDGGTALGSSIGFAGPIALDSKDGLYLGDNNGNNYGVPNEIRYIDAASGLITNAVGFMSPGAWASSTGFGTTVRIVVTVSGTHYLFTAARGGTSGTSAPTWPTTLNARVTDGTIIWQNNGVYTGSGCPAQTDSYGDGCVATQAVVGNIGGIVVDSANNIYFSDDGAQRIRRVDAVTKIVTSIAGTGTAAYSGDGGLATAAAVESPTDMAFDSNGNLFFIDGNTYLVREINKATGIISTITGKQINSTVYNTCGGGGGDGGPALAANFAYLTSLAIDAANDIYLVDRYACNVRRIDAGTNLIHTVVGAPGANMYNVGFGDFNQNYSDGDATAAVLAEPQIIRLDGNANLYIASDFGGVRKVNVAQSVLNFGGSSYTYSASNQQQIDTVSSPLTATVLNAGNSGTVDFLTPFDSGPNWGISTPNYIRDVTSPTGANDCYTLQSLTVGNTCPVSVDYAPLSGSGWQYAFNTVDTNVETEDYASLPITLIGYASGTPPLVTLTPFLLSFRTTQGSTSPAKILTLSNNDVNPLPIASIVINGSSAFSQTNNCGTVLAAQSTCAISVTFSPPVLPGPVTPIPPDSLTAMVVVTDAAGNSPQTAELVGTGSNGDVAADGFFPVIQETAHFTDTVTLVPSTLLNISETVTFTDTIPAPVESTLLNVSEAVHFTDTYPGLIAASVTINVKEAISVGDTDRVLLPIVIADNEAIHLTDLDQTLLPIVIADVEAIKLTDAIQTLLPIVIADVEAIKLTDSPIATAQSGVVAISPTALAFGSVPNGVTAGPLVATITNSSSSTVSISAIAASGVFSIASKTCGATLVVGATCTVSVQFTPNAVSGFSGTLSVTDSATNSPQSIPLSGSGATYSLTVTPQNASRNFDTANPTFAYNITGFIGGDTSAVVSGTPLLTTTATLNSMAGSYPITGTNGTLSAPAKYGFVFASGTLTVNGNAAQTITFPSIANIPFTFVHALTLTAHSTSGLPITYTVTGPATINGSRLTLTVTGTVKVTASQSGNSTFAPATSVARSFTVTP